MAKNKHLTAEERRIIADRLKEKESFKSIGNELGKDCTTTDMIAVASQMLIAFVPDAFSGVLLLHSISVLIYAYLHVALY